jgi:hypothetical protein
VSITGVITIAYAITIGIIVRVEWTWVTSISDPIFVCIDGVIVSFADIVVIADTVAIVIWTWRRCIISITGVLFDDGGIVWGIFIYVCIRGSRIALIVNGRELVFTTSSQSQSEGEYADRHGFTFPINHTSDWPLLGEETMVS